ncbi:MAG TPA: transglycosylase domain-containing protein [Streptosporangiaceae bacterium]
MQGLAALAALALVAGVLAGLLALPATGLAGLVVRDATQTFNTLPEPALASLPARSEILDANGGLIASYYPNHIYRVPVTYGQISPDMRNAIVAIEDARFYQHGAIDTRGTLRAVAADLGGGQVQGGSTLAQQYVKNALLLTATTPAQQQAATADTLGRKLRELRIAAQVEHQLTSKQLLTAYLNVAYFDNQAYGVQVAAERYFSVPAADLTLTESALLAGLVQNPVRFNPLTNPQASVARRNTVLTRMAQLHYITPAQAAAARRTPLQVRPSAIPVQDGCQSNTGATDDWFCDYVVAELRTNPAYRQAYQRFTTTGGLMIYTTLNPRDQAAAQNAVNYMLPPPPSGWNPGSNAASEVLVQPGTGYVTAIAVDRRYGSGPGQDSVDYAVDSAQDGGAGVQTGSSSKLFTLIAALREGLPFGFRLQVSSPAVLTGFRNCQGQSAGDFPVSNAEGPGRGTYTLYTATTQSINVFFAHLEKRVGLCQVVKTAVSMGVHRADGGSLMSGVGRPGSVGYQPPADDLPSFTLGSVEVSPMSMAAAYATVAAGGIYCAPVAISRILAPSGHGLPVAMPHCHRAIPAAVANAATYILRGVLTTGTAKGDAVTVNGRTVDQAGKTGTANSFDYAAFGGYTPDLAGYVSMFNPTGPVSHPMAGVASCFRSASGGRDCPGSVFGASAGLIWQYTFENADLVSPAARFGGVPADSTYFRAGTGTGQAGPRGGH